MASKKKAKARSEVTAAEESAIIAEQTQAFLSSGGQIEQIEKGRSGVDFSQPKKNIVITPSKSQK